MLLEALYDDRIFGLDPQLLFQLCFQILAVFLLFLLGSYLLIEPVRKILNNRKERVMREQKEAREARDEAVRFCYPPQERRAEQSLPAFRESAV